MASYVNTCIACIAHVIKPLLVTSAKQWGYPCSAGSPNELSELPGNVHSEFPSTMVFLHASHCGGGGGGGRGGGVGLFHILFHILKSGPCPSGYLQSNRGPEISLECYCVARKIANLP